MNKGPFDYSRFTVTVKRTPGFTSECQGAPAHHPDELGIQVSGTIRIAIDWDRTECTTCTSWDGMRCIDGFDQEPIQERLNEILEDAKPILYDLGEDVGVKLRINALGFTEITPSYAVAEVLDCEVVK